MFYRGRGRSDASSVARPYDVSSLRNEIHPIWQQANFLGGSHTVEFNQFLQTGEHIVDTDEAQLTNSAYQTLQPALQLATLFLQHSRPFFLKILFANIIGERLDLSYKPTTVDEAEFDKILEDISKRYRIYVGPNEAGHYMSHPCRSGSTCNYFSQRNHPIYGAINPSYLVSCSPSQRVKISTTSFHQICFELAITCVHELAHVLNLVRDCREIGYQTRSDTRPFIRKRKLTQTLWTRKEPYCMPTEAEPELGRALEIYILEGGELRLSKTIEEFCQRRTGLCWRMSGVPAHDPKRKDIGIVPSSISRFFDAAAWTCVNKPQIVLCIDGLSIVGKEGTNNHLREVDTNLQ